MSAYTPKSAAETLVERNWRVDQIAEAVGCHQATIYRLLNGELEPRFKVSAAIVELAKSGRKGPKPAKARKVVS